jgi:hypothetical protein
MSAQIPSAEESGSPLTDTQELIAYCGRPMCRQEFRRSLGPGRPQSYCSEMCRRMAEREYRQTSSRLANFEAVVEQLRIDVAAFGRSVDAHDGLDGVPAVDMRRKAEDAIQHAGGAVAFVRESTDAAARELCALYDAVAPIIGK